MNEHFCWCNCLIEKTFNCSTNLKNLAGNVAMQIVIVSSLPRLDL